MNKLSSTILLLVALFLSSCGGSKDASQNEQGPNNGNRRSGPPSVEQIFEMDTDGDNLLSREEVKGRMANDFDRIDTNSDGYLTKEEVKNAPRPERKSRGPKQ